MEKISVLPMFIARGGHLKRELPEMMESLRSRFPVVEFVLAGAVGEEEAVIQAMAEVALKVIG
jgi:sirohydrochlorin cobaltochelatase